MDAFPASGGAVPEMAYRVVFGFIGLMLALGLLACLGAADSKPRPPLGAGTAASR